MAWYDAAAPWYDRFADPFEASVRSRGIDLLAVEPGESVLDVGCGTGRALVEFASDVGTDGRAVGLDLAPAMCREAKAALEAAELEETGTVVRGDARSIPIADDAVDAVFASFVLELFDTPTIPVVLAEWRRILDPGGRICVVALSRRTAGPVTRLYELVHRLAPTAADCRPIYLRETLSEAGFRPLETRHERVWHFPAEVVVAGLR